MTGPATRRNTGTDFQEQIDRLFRDAPPEPEEKEDAEEGDKDCENE